MLRSYARAAGAAYLVIIATGIFAEFFVRSSLIVPGDAAATAANIGAGETLYRWGLAAEFVMLTADLFLAVALWVLFRGVSRNLALFAAFLRVAHASIVAVNLLNVYVPLLLLGGSGYLGVFGPGQLEAMALVFLEAHSYGYVIGLVFFGVHCLVMGWLVLRARFAPALLGGLLLLAGLGYLVDGAARTLLTDYTAVENVFMMVVFLPAFIGELSFALWLLIKAPAPVAQDAPVPVPA